MATNYTIPETNKSVLMNKIDSLAQLNPEGAVRKNLGEAFDFSSAWNLFEAIRVLFTRCKLIDLSQLTDTKVQALNKITADLTTALGEVNAFDVRSSNALERRKAIIRDVNASFDQAYDAFAVVFAVSTSGDMERYRREAQEQAGEITKSLEEERRRTLAKFSAGQKELEELLKEVRTAATEIGIEKHSSVFANEAKRHQRLSIQWLAVVILLSGVTFFLAGFNYYHSLPPKPDATKQVQKTQSDPLPEPSVSSYIQFGIAKVVAFSVLITALIWAGKIYRSHQHNYVVNKHRNNALLTFQTFAKGAGDDLQTKNAVLLQATSCIFSPQSTGYLSGEKESESFPPILEVVRNLGATPK